MTTWNIPKFEPGVSKFEEWIEVLDAFVRADPEMTVGRAVCLLKAYGGSYVIRLLKTLPDVGVHVSARRMNAYEAAVKKLKDYFDEESNVFLERAKFRDMKQLQREPTKKFVFRLREQASRCEFTNAEEQIYEQLVQGLADGKAKRKALLKPTTVAAIVKEANLNESIQVPVSEDSNVNWINDRDSSRPRRNKVCHFCKKPGHFVRECQELKKETCSLCKKKGHTASRCWSGTKPERKSKLTKKISNVNYVEESDEEVKDTKQDLMEHEYLFFMEGDDEIRCSIGGVEQVMLIDSGAKKQHHPEQYLGNLEGKRNKRA